MSSNFSFIEAVDREIYDRCLTAERTAYTDLRTSLAHSRMALELAVYWMYNEDSNLILPYRPDLNLLMKERESFDLNSTTTFIHKLIVFVKLETSLFIITKFQKKIL